MWVPQVTEWNGYLNLEPEPFCGKSVWMVMVGSAKPRSYQAFPVAVLDYEIKLIM